MTKEEAIKTLKGEAWVCCAEKWNEALEIAIEALEQEPEQESEWTLISEQEPTTASHVLVSTTDGVVCEVDYAVMKHDAFENTLIQIFLESIVAWMPLPKPYK